MSLNYSPTGAPSSVTENIPVPLTAIYAILFPSPTIKLLFTVFAGMISQAVRLAVGLVPTDTAIALLVVDMRTFSVPDAAVC